MGMRLALGVLAALCLGAASCPAAPPPATPPAAAPPVAGSRAPIAGFRVVRTYPHDPKAFTEGLFYLNGSLYESTGLEGRSTIRRVDLDSGKVIQQRSLDPHLFGEGIVASGNRLIQLTWRSNIGFTYGLDTFAKTGQFSYSGEGWGLTRIGNRIVMSDGTADLRLLDATTLKEVGRLHVTDGGVPVPQLNELEYVEGEIFANVFQTDFIARISPVTGKILGWIDLTGLLRSPHGRGVTGEPDVLNGIAYDAAKRRLLVTGKLWDKIYEIRVSPAR